MSSINAAGLALIKRHEGLRLDAYLCPAGVLTIGYGHTGDVRPLQRITQQEADALLLNDVARFEKGVSALVVAPLNDNQFSALVCFAFNIGLGALAASTLLSLLNRGWYQQVPAQFMRWTKAGGCELQGLIKRRRDETFLWSM
jgi:lysozyme